MQTRKSFLLPFAAALVVAACGGDTPPPPAPQPASTAPTAQRPQHILSDEALAERRRAATLSLVKPSAVGASLASAMEVSNALDLPAGMVTGSSLVSLNPQAAMVLPRYGNDITPRRGDSLVVLSTGNINVANLPEPGTDYPPVGVDGDVVTFRVTLNVPLGNNRMSFDYRFLSAESPEYIGTQFNDTFNAHVEDSGGRRLVATASVNSSTFFDVSTTRAAGTGYDTLFADDPAGVDYFPVTYPPDIMRFPDAGITDFRTANFEVIPGGSITLEFDIRDLGDGVLDSAVVIDNITFANMEVVDPNPTLLHHFLGTVLTDTSLLVNSTSAVPHVRAVAADGVTQVLLRSKFAAAGRVTFSISGTSPANGGVGAVGTSERAATVAVNTVPFGGVHYAFALYTAPADFDSGGFSGVSSRPLTLSANYVPTTGTGFTTQVALDIVRPPVVLVHDLWSSCDFISGAGSIKQSPLFEVTCADYSSTASESMLSAANTLVVPETIHEALDEMRQRQIAVAQADVVAHGMGGLLARRFVDWSNYYGFDSFNQGTINRLITLNTPHVGTRLANEIVAMRDFIQVENATTWGQVKDSLAALNPPILLQDPLDPAKAMAIDDLKVQSDVIKLIRQTPVPTHVLTSQGAQGLARTPTTTILPDNVKVLYTKMETNHPLVYGNSNTAFRMKLILGPDSHLFCNDPHDVFVATWDQRGGLPVGSTAVSPFDVTTGNRDSEHFKVPNDTAHRDRLVALLNSPVGGPNFTTTLPSPFGLGSENGCTGFAPMRAPEEFAAARETLRLASAAAGSLTITSPAPGTQVTPGGYVTVAVAGTGGFAPQTVGIIGGGRATILEAGPFTTQFQIPVEALGSVTFSAFGIDAQGQTLYAPKVTLPVVTSAQLKTLEVLNGDATLSGPGATRKLVVHGVYSDGVTRDVSSATLGTRYSTSNTGIATITADGTLTGVAPGMATVMVLNGTVLTSITVTVGDTATNQCIPVRLGEYNLFVLNDYSEGNEVYGKIAAGRNVSLKNFSVGTKLAENDVSNVLVVGGNLTLVNGSVWGDARYGGKYVVDGKVSYPRGTVAKATPINFAAQGNWMRALSSNLGNLPPNGKTVIESWGGVYLTGTNKKTNIFDVDASVFKGTVLLTIEAPTKSHVIINVRGDYPVFTNFGHVFNGGIDETGVLFNFPDATSITAFDYGFYGTVLAPNADINFNEGSFVGGIYARSLKGNAVGQINRLRDTDICN
ncbi:choice-of-anchor A family protein [Myxococcus sp. K15C18031901]|uniref:choice-of-anchor A family protein n=1 Tax=Myxococcus dinghuensis TaxID=2906761 RepID=UPI0020A7A725|nr:choice-of-anchor A family protein [Myxococcus dinghuensis]MCP3101098.1 choice-of-anchor A family protein [Myxococcus dinghuensis]